MEEISPEFALVIFSVAIFTTLLYFVEARVYFWRYDYSQYLIKHGVHGATAQTMARRFYWSTLWNRAITRAQRDLVTLWPNRIKADGGHA